MKTFDELTHGLDVENRIAVAGIADEFQRTRNGLQEQVILHQKDSMGLYGSIDPVVHEAVMQVLGKTDRGALPKSLLASVLRGVIEVTPYDLDALDIGHNGEPMPIDAKYGQIDFSDIATQKAYSFTDITFDSNGVAIEGQETPVYNNRILSLVQRNHADFVPPVEINNSQDAT